MGKRREGGREKREKGGGRKKGWGGRDKKGGRTRKKKRRTGEKGRTPALPLWKTLAKTASTKQIMAAAALLKEPLPPLMCPPKRVPPLTHTGTFVL